MESITQMATLILSSLGLTYILSRSQILEKPRMYLAKKNQFLGDLLYCHLCTSFWVGAIISALLGYDVLISALIVLGAVWLIELCQLGDQQN